MDSKEISAEVEPKLESAIRTFKQTAGYGGGESAAAADAAS
jgi:hypothetical protein